MARKRKIIESLEITGIADKGRGVGRTDNKVVFVDGAVPGDVVKVKVNKSKPSYAEGKVLETLSPSPFREDAFCEHFRLCGGCKWQDLSYEKQLEFKHNEVIEAFKRIGKVINAEVESPVPSEKTTFYRNKLEYTFSNQRWLEPEEISSGEDINRNGVGFHIPGRHDRVVDVKKCWLQTDSSNDIRNSLRDFAAKNDLTYYDFKSHTGLLRNLIIRTSTTGELMVIVQFGENDPESIDLVMNFLKDSFSEITSLQYIINLKMNETFFDQEVVLFNGKPVIEERMPVEKGGEEYLSYMISPKSFYQTNSEQAFELYHLARAFAELKGDEIVYDLYTGTGTIANFVAHKAKKVVGIEYVEAAVEDARINSTNNNISNTVFYAGDMKDLLNKEMFEKEGYPDTVITDPPRAGMHADVVNALLEAQPSRIVYVSCNPATQARDIALLSEKYEVKRIKPVDMFPHTHHIENVALLDLK
ncbi:23S rRNA (uracil(1939)-C(5))-methyltransferase RlmD [Marinigracilibium pacificum]|uniref:23S rRNA (Uracil(1939)-C(5))-methyltransferase RlmD n=1 Tax=Marinigracilibium pacificum TaxID=2729599 RepID=A0A848IWM2_9BACT|nr:23S rRNA (uracil(1939)-C(5))-methyltransferase RlmD [Marinigracilibium pacificum]NMM48923.1 23S rRNA (uracil(1939)-C(5))-methyltransferase RlmD [Marinigracilibium pacificum]